MKIDFRIDWGYQYLYSRRHYHPVYIWDGSITCDVGSVNEVYALDYPYTWFGPVLTAQETKLEGNSWQSRTKRGMAGVRVAAEAADKTVFCVNSASASVCFSAHELLSKGRLEFPVGPKYLGNSIMITLSGYLWFENPPKDGEKLFKPFDIRADKRKWARMDTAWIEPGATAEWEYTVPENGADVCEELVHITAMGAPPYSSEKEVQISDYFPLEILCDGKTVLSYKRFYRSHDHFVQLPEDDFKTVSVTPGKHIFGLKNNNENNCLAVMRIVMKHLEYSHGELSVPAWSLSGEQLVGKVFSAADGVMPIAVDDKKIIVDCKNGWNEFRFASTNIGTAEICSPTDKKTIKVYDCTEENPPVKVGYDMTVVPHDENGFMDFVLDYTQHTRMGNYVVFRSALPNPVDDKLLYKWGKYCREHGIYVSDTNNFDSGYLADGAKACFHDCGMHEYPGRVYACDPTEPYASSDMKEASEKYIDFLKIEIDRAHKVCQTAAFGDASGGIRYSFLAGADFVRAETMVGHTMTLLTRARPAAEALGKGSWGVHIAIQHGYQPYHETHLGQYFLSLMQPWMMGAEVIYEEDSLFSVWKEERQAWSDKLAKGKRDMTRRFFEFVKTHPRRGKHVRSIAYIDGRYAAPFNGFICDTEQDPHYSVWGMFGNDMPQWGHCQPEKSQHLLDVLMPGACTMPMRQRFDKRRFFFSGTPYGDFDCIPAEADEKYLESYKLLIHCGWNTMIDEDYAKLKAYVENGGTLLIGIMQLSTNTRREFLKDFNDVNLYNDGDVSDLCGIKVIGRGDEYCGQWNCRGRELIDEPVLSSLPNDSEDEDGVAYLANVELRGAEAVAWDFESGKPILVKCSIGKGTVYTFTQWAYPGHQRFQRFSAAWIKILAAETLGDEYVSDPSEEIFWTKRKDGDKTIFMLLNTDWTQKGNVKTAQIICKGITKTVTVAERTAVTAECLGNEIVVSTYSVD